MKLVLYRAWELFGVVNVWNILGYNSDKTQTMMLTQDLQNMLLIARQSSCVHLVFDNNLFSDY
jgi:hypothetical protein